MRYTLYMFVSFVLITSGCASSRYQSAKMSQELPKIESFLNHYKGSHDPVIQEYLQELSRDRDQVLWYQSLKTDTEDGYGDYLNSAHQPKRFVNEAERRYDGKLFERVIKEDLQALSLYQSNCQECSETHINYIKRLMCRSALSPAVEQLVLLTGEDYAYQTVTKHCVLVSDPVIAREAKALITLKTVDPRTFYERSSELFDQSCKYPKKYQIALVARHKEISANIASLESYLELRRHLEGAFVSDHGMRCSANYIDTARLKAGTSAMTTKMQRQARNDQKRKFQFTEAEILGSESLNEEEFCSTVDREIIGLCSNDQKRLWMKAYKVDSREYRSLCKLLSSNQKRCKRQVGDRLSSVRKAYEQTRFKLAVKAIKTFECVHDPQELRTRCDTLLESFSNRCTKTLNQKLKRCERILAKNTPKPVEPVVKSSKSKIDEEPRILEARPLSTPQEVPSSEVTAIPTPKAEERSVPALREVMGSTLEEAPATPTEEAPATPTEEAPATPTEEAPATPTEEAPTPAAGSTTQPKLIEMEAPTVDTTSEEEEEEEEEEVVTEVIQLDPPVKKIQPKTAIEEEPNPEDASVKITDN